MIKNKPKEIVMISKLMIKLFRYMREGLDIDERKELADDLTDLLIEIIESTRINR